jgi:CHAD domain-containing protein
VRAPTPDRAVTKAKHWRIADVVRDAVSTAVSRLDTHEPALWTERDPEAVHQARVATRRLRSDLKTLGDFVDEEWARQLRGELRWLGGELGQVRDIEVLRERLTNHAGLLPDADADGARSAIRRLDADHATARTELLRSLRQPRYAQLHRALHDALSAPRLAPAAQLRANDALPGAVRPAWRKLRRAADALGSVPSDAALHQVRIRAKRARYAAELATPVFGGPARRFAEQMAHVQDVLGEHQDAVVADRWLAKTAPECTPAEAYALGMLAEIERGLAVRARAAFTPAWETARARSLRGWL